MKSPLAKNLIKYGVSAVICLLLIWVYISTHVDFDNLAVTARLDWYLVICDAFTIPGLLFILSGLLMSVSNQGALDGVGYVVSRAVKMLIPGAAANQERYWDYLERRHQKKLKGYGFLYIVGAVCMAVALVFFVLFYSHLAG